MSSAFVPDDAGHMLSQEHLRIAQIIHDYDERLELAWIPPESRELNDVFPFAVMYNNPQSGIKEIVMRLRETEVDHRVIARLWGSDSKNGNVLDSIEKDEQARRALEMLRQEDEEAERREMAAWMIKAPAGARINGQRLT